MKLSASGGRRGLSLGLSSLDRVKPYLKLENILDLLELLFVSVREALGQPLKRSLDEPRNVIVMLGSDPRGTVEALASH